MKFGIIIQARTGASRLPNKVLKKLAGKPLLWHVVKRCRASKHVNQVVVATTTKKNDNAIEYLCARNNIPCFRGSSNNVLDRYYKTAKKFNISTIARVTSDCPLIDPATIDRCYRALKNQGCDYISNIVPGTRTFPRGLDVELFSFKTLKTARDNASQNYEKEHVTPYIWENKKNEFKLGKIVTAPPGLKRNYRLTVDYPEDFALIDTIYEKFRGHKIISISKVISFLDAHPELAAINNACEQKHNKHAPVNLLQRKTKIAKNGKFDAIIILGGPIVKTDTGWRMSDYTEGDNFGVTGDKLRVLAAYYLYLNKAGNLFIASGGRAQHKHIKGAPPAAEVVKKELINLGLPQKLIVLEANSNNTYQQLKKLKKIMTNKQLNKVGLVSNCWHLPRIQAFLEYMPELSSVAAKIKLISAEDILVKYDSPKWKAALKKIKQSPEFQKRTVAEQEGIARIKSGDYKFRRY